MKALKPLKTIENTWGVADLGSLSKYKLLKRIILDDSISKVLVENNTK